MPINTPTGYLDITNATLRGSKIVTTGNIGIANANPVNHLSVGSNLHINDTHSNVLQISGNINAASVVLGGISIAPTFDLEIVTNTGNTTPYTVEFNNTATAFVTTANATIGNILTASKFVGDGSGISAIQSSNVTDFASNVSRIGALESSRALGSDLDNNSSRISTISTNLSDVTTDLGDNSSRITALESGDISLSGEKTFTGQVIFESNIHMNGGNVLVANTVNMRVSDPIIELGSNNLNTGDLGIIMTRHNNHSNIAIAYDEDVDILRMGYTLNGADDTTIELDSNAMAVDVQGALTVGGNVQCTNLHASNLTMNLVTMTGAQTFEQVVNKGRILNSNVLIISNATPSTSSATGALTLTAGGLGVEGNVYIGSNLTVTDETTLSNLSVTGETTLSNLSVTGETVEVANLAVTSGSLELTQVANVFQVKSSANVVTEYVRSKKVIKYPRVAMTANSSGGYVASASSERSPSTSYAAYKAFNMIWNSGSYTDGWNIQTNTNYNGTDNAYNPSADNPTRNLGTGAVDGEWLKLELPVKVLLQNLKIYSRWNDPTRAPEDFKVYGSNDNTNWVELLSQTGQQPPATGQEYEVYTNVYYKYFGLVVTKIFSQNNYFAIDQVEYYAIPEYDPDAHGTDVIARSVPNVPNTDWLEVYYDGQDYSGVTSTVTDKAGTATNATITNTNNEITFDSTYGAWTFGGTNTRTSKMQSSALPGTFSGDQVHSVALWFKCDIVSGDTLFSITQPSSPWEDSEKVISVRFSDSSGGLRYIFWSNDIHYHSADANISKDRWYHLCATYSGGGGTTDNKKLYLNGNELRHTATSGGSYGNNLALPSGSVIQIGSRVQDTLRFFGSIANFRLFNRALTTDEIWQLYAYQKDYFQVSPDVVTFKGGRLGIGTEEPKAILDVRGSIHANGGQSWPIPTAIFSNITPSNTGSTYYNRNIGTEWIYYNTILKEDLSGTIESPTLNTDQFTLNRTGMYEFYVESALSLQGSNASHISLRILNKNVGGSLTYLRADGYEVFQSDYIQVKNAHRTQMILVTEAPVVVGYYLQPQSNYTNRFKERAYGSSMPIHIVSVKYLG